VATKGFGIARLPYRRGNWNNGGNAGPVALNFNNPRSNRGSSVGSRLVFAS
jgi:hypothetical protein